MVTPEPHSTPGPMALASSPIGRVRSSGMWPWVPLIIVGGTAGTAARAMLESAFPPSPAALPWVTLVINVTGSFVLGLLLEILAAAGPDRGRRRAIRLTVGTGVLGGFTTYSTFMIEAANRLRDGQVVIAVTYLVGSVLLGLVAAGAGIGIAVRIRHARIATARGGQR